MGLAEILGDFRNMTGKQIQQLRHSLGESVDEFGKRFFVRGRTVESWEGDRNRPHPAVLAQVKALARKLIKRSA